MKYLTLYTDIIIILIYWQNFLVIKNNHSYFVGGEIS